MDKFFTVAEIPVGHKFKLQGSSVEITKTGRDLYEVGVYIPLHPDYPFLANMSPESLTQTVRDIFLIDPTKVLASFMNNFLVDVGDGYVLETYGADGRVHFAQFFKQSSLHRAMSALQALMPEEIPSTAMTEIKRPCGTRRYSNNVFESVIIDTFFIGYGEKLNSIEKMELILNKDGWTFNDLREEQELCINPET